MRHLLAALVVLIPLTCHAVEDPCTAAGHPGTMWIDGTGRAFCQIGGGMNASGLEQYLMSKQIELLRQLVASTNEMKTSISSLKVAVDALNKANTDLYQLNAKWRSNTLDATLSKLEKMPAELAKQEILVEALSASLVDRIAHKLASDKEFLDAIKRQ